MSSNSMEKHGKHGTAFSHNFRQHGKAWGAWKSMGSMVSPLFMFLNSMEKHGKHGTEFPDFKLHSEKMPLVKINTG